MPGECIFCAIASGVAPAEVIDADEHTVAFMDIHPWRPGHALVIPRRHSENLLEIDPDDLGRVYASAQRLATRMSERLNSERVYLWNSCGSAAGQVVPHFHLHLIPGSPDDPEIPPRPSSPPSREDIQAVAAQLRGG